MALYCSLGSASAEITSADLQSHLTRALAALGERRRILLVPPDATRFHSRAGEISQMAYAHYGDRVRAILPALGTHTPMPEAAIARMFGSLPRDLFRVHHWRTGVRTLGHVPAEYVREQSEGRVHYSYPAQVDHLLLDGPGPADPGPFDLILSIGQVVPHEVIGMANHSKNILVGLGGPEGIDRSHYLGAVYGMERIMGRADTPVRRVLNYAADHFLRHLPIVYVLTVVGRAEDGRLVLRGLFIGDDQECFLAASALAFQVNFTLLERPIHKAVVYLDPHEFHSTWLGNKAIYRTRMALADHAELIILAPGVREFGEDGRIDRLIRKYGYRGTPYTLRAVGENEDLAGNLSAAAHLIHGSTEERFQVTYCPGALSKEEIESVNYRFGSLRDVSTLYDTSRLRDGWNTAGGDEIFYISNPGLGLWAHRDRFHA